MYQLGIRYSQPVHFGHFGENVAAGNFFFSASTFWPFSAKMYRLEVFHSQQVHFGHFRRECTGWGFFIPSRYISAILGEKVPAGEFLFSAGTF